MNKKGDVLIPIIILNWNGLEDTLECMRSVLKLKKIRFHLYLVDNASDNNEGDLLFKKFNDLPEVEVVLNDENLGFTKGNNRIISQILEKGHQGHIALLNNDTVVTPDWLYEIHQAAIRNKADMVSSKMVNYYDRSIMDNAGHFMLNTAEILPVGHAKPVEAFQEVFENLGACGGGALYSVKMLKTIGIFDEFFDTGYEDAELGLRANKAGFLSIFAPRAVLYHKVSRSIKQIRDDNYFIKIQRNIFYTYIKLMPSRYILLNLPFITAKYLFLFLGALLSLRLKLIKLHVRTIWLFFTKDLSKALTNRKMIKTLNTEKRDNPYINKIQFFLATDVRRFIMLFSSNPQG